MRRVTSLALLAVIALSLSSVKPVAAQEGALDGVEQRITYIYGHSMTFQVYGTATQNLLGARLTVRVAGSDQVYSEAIPISAGTNISISHPVPVSSLGIPPAAIVEAHWDFQDERGVELRTTTHSIPYIDNTVPFEWQETARDIIHIYTPALDTTVGPTALDIATNALIAARYTLGEVPQEDLYFYIYPELPQLASALRLHQLSINDWVTAYAIPTQHTAMLTASSGPDLMSDLERDLPHMLMHLVIAANAGPFASQTPGWFIEGLALEASGSREPALTLALETSTRDGALLPLDSLCRPDFGALLPQQSSIAYSQSRSLVHYITNRYGISAIRDLMENYAAGLSCSGAVEVALGITLADLETQWHNDLLRQAAQDIHEANSMTPWVIVWVVSIVLAWLFIAPQPGRHKVRSGRSTFP
jgi:hypothetical protein